MPLNEQERADLTDAIAHHCEEIRRMFTPGAKVTVLVRCPQTPGDGDVLVTSDDDEAILIALKRRIRCESNSGGICSAQCERTRGHAGFHEAHPYGEGGLLSW